MVRRLHDISETSDDERGAVMVDQATKRRVTQAHLDAISADSGPVYGVRLIKSLPIVNTSMRQAMPSKDDLQLARPYSERTVAGYEVLLSHYRAAMEVVHLRKCHDCGNVAYHADSVAPYVKCRKCGSMDTRKVNE